MVFYQPQDSGLPLHPHIQSKSTILPFSTCYYCSSSLSLKLSSRHDETHQKASSLTPPTPISHFSTPSTAITTKQAPNGHIQNDTGQSTDQQEQKEQKPQEKQENPPTSLQVPSPQSITSTQSSTPFNPPPPHSPTPFASPPPSQNLSSPSPSPHIPTPFNPPSPHSTPSLQLNPKPPSPPPAVPTTPSKAKTKAELEQDARETMARLTSTEPPPPAKRMARVSEEREFHGREFDTRVHALKYLLSSSHFATLLRRSSTTREQAQQLMAVAEEFKFVDDRLLYALLKYYSVRADVTGALRVVELLRVHGVPYLERERKFILRAQRRARLFTEGTLRGEVIRMWEHIGDADMCMRCYETMRAASTHPGEAGFASLLRVFRERGDDATCARLLAEMGTVGFDHFLFKGKKESAEADVKLGLENFKSLLRYHAELVEEDVCARVLEEMRKRGVEEDEETRSIVASIQTKVQEEEEIQPRSAPKFSNARNTSISEILPIPPVITPSGPKSTYEMEKENWKQMKQSSEPPTPHLIHSLLRSAARQGDDEMCEQLLSAMDTHAITRTAETYACVMEACKANYARCEELFAAMRAQEMRPALPAYNTMLWIFCAQRRDAEAFALFEEMKDVADTISYNTLMRVYAGDGNLQSVMLLSAQMKERTIAHDAATYTIMVELLGRFGIKGMVVVDAVVREIQQSEIQPDMILFDTLLDVYGGVGNWEMCEKVWHDMKGKTVLGEASCARFLQKHCYKDPSIYVKWKKEFSNFLPP